MGMVNEVMGIWVLELERGIVGRLVIVEMRVELWIGMEKMMEVLDIRQGVEDNMTVRRRNREDEGREEMDKRVVEMGEVGVGGNESDVVWGEGRFEEGVGYVVGMGVVVERERKEVFAIVWVLEVRGERGGEVR